MIATLRGKILEKDAGLVVIECAGVGYEVNIPLSTYNRLGDVGQDVLLHTVFIVREDAQLLYGFIAKSDKTVFSQLLKVSGVGPRTALSILSSMSAGDIGNAIANHETSLLTKVPGIGKKTAERLILELKDKVAVISDSMPMTGTQGEILQALLALGFTDREAKSALKTIPEDTELNEGIRLCLRYLGSRG